MSTEFVRQIVTVVADGAGDGSSVSSHPAGRIVFISYDGGHGAGASVSVVTTARGEVVWSESVATAKIVRPSVPIHDSAGTEQAQRDFIWLASDSLTITVTGADASSTGEFEIVTA